MLNSDTTCSTGAPTTLSRQERHRRLSSHLAATGDEALRALLAGAQCTDGWGTHRVLEVDGAAVFAKSVPLTAREFAQPECTANVFGLPTVYSYGVGSRGFGVWRELAMHHKTTAWVLSGAIDTFPLLLHARVLAVASPPRAMPPDDLDKYVAYWDGSEEIRQFILARQRATHEVVFFLEHVPHVLRDWLGTDPDKLALVMEGMARTTAFLRSHGVAHFDAHLGNILSDGRQVFLTDYGLALDAAFDLSPDERAFLHAHEHFDAAELLMCLGRPLRGDVPDGYRARLRAYEPAIAAMESVFAALKDGPKGDAGYDDDRVARLLADAGWPG